MWVAALATRPSITRPEVPGFRIEGELGSGGFARVWRAYATDHGEPVALKIGHSAAALTCARFEREAAALAVIGQPHVPELHEHGFLDDGRPYLAMECVDGETLVGSKPAEPVIADPGWLARICDSVLTNLAAVHAKGFVHLDIKPENILVTHLPGLCTKLVDFGLCRSAGDLAQNVGDMDAAGGEPPMILGSVAYMSPEHLAGEPGLGLAADIYSFGVILYELVTGCLPFTGERDAIVRGHLALRPPRPTSLAPIPVSLEVLCMACLSKKPEERPTSIVLLRDALHRSLREMKPQISTPSTLRSGSVKLLTGARQPVVLMAVEGSLGQSEVLAMVQKHKGFVARLQGQRYVCAFSGARSETPLDDALACARELRDHHGARVTLHIADLKLRPGKEGQPPRVYGPAVEKPESWLPGAPLSEIYLTPSASEALKEPTVPAVSAPGFYTLAPDPGPDAGDAPHHAVKLVGREHVLDRARQSIRACMDSKAPRMFTILGEHGLGKSRLCREIGRVARDEAPDAVIISIRAHKPTPGSPHPTWSLLVDELGALDTAEDTISKISAIEAHRATAIQLLGDELRHAAGKRLVVIIIDDIQFAAGAVLDALEYAVLDGEHISLWIAVAGLPRFERRRPKWGTHAHSHERIVLVPLSQDEAMELAVALLRPAEYPPPATLRQLADWTAGNPYWLTALIENLKRGGMVRQGRQQGSFYVATEELAHLPALPVGQWLAERELGRLSAELAAFARVCAVLGSEFLRDELVWVQHAAEITHAASTNMDTDVGLDELARQGILVRLRNDIWAFREILFQDGIYKLIGRDDCEALHRSALAYWRERGVSADPERALSAIARHAEASSDKGTAADAYMELGHRARAEHRYVDADVHYTRALELTDEANRQRLTEALKGRGKVRYRLQRIHESIEDLRRARVHAEATSQVAIIADLLLEEATALDWAGKYEESAALVAAAGPLIDELYDPGRAGRYLMALGRSAYREERTPEAMEILVRARQLVIAHKDHEAAIITLLLLGPLLVQLERLDQAEACFNEVIALCLRSNDRFHLCVAHLNRAWFWLAGQSLHGAMNDLRRAQQLARELNQPILERGAAHNLAELLHWSGEHDLARGPARRAYGLQRFLPDPVPTDALLLGRVLIACDELDEAHSLVAHARHLLGPGEPGKPPSRDELALRMLELALAEADGVSSAAAWDGLITAAEAHLPGEEVLEIHYFRARTAVKGARWGELAAILERVDERLAKCPIWRAAFARLADCLPARTTAGD